MKGTFQIPAYGTSCQVRLLRQYHSLVINSCDFLLVRLLTASWLMPERFGLGKISFYVRPEKGAIGAWLCRGQSGSGVRFLLMLRIRLRKLHCTAHSSRPLSAHSILVAFWCPFGTFRVHFWCAKLSPLGS